MVLSHSRDIFSEKNIKRVKKILTHRRRDRKGTQSLSENFFQKVFVLNVSAASVWIHVCYTFNNSLRLCVYKIWEKRCPADRLWLHVLKLLIKIKCHYDLYNLSEGIAGFSMNKVKQYRELAYGTVQQLSLG